MSDTTILIIDEYPDVCELQARRLNSLWGFRVVAHTSNPIIGAELAHLWQPDIIVSDFKRRGSYAAKMYTWIKKASPRSQLVVLTSYLRNGDQELYLQAGAAKCLLKDLKLANLEGELQELAASGAKEDVHV